MRLTSSQTFFGLGFGSLALAVGAFFYLRADVREIVPVIFCEATLIFLSALLVERSLLAEANDRAHERAEKLARELDNSVRKVIGNTLNDAKYAAEYNVHILPPRRSLTKNPNVTYKVIAETIREAKWVKVFCTTGLDIFSLSSDPNSIGRVISEHARKGINGPNNVVRPFEIAVLSVKPDGRYAKFRGRVENPNLPDFIAKDTESAMKTLRNMLAGPRALLTASGTPMTSRRRPGFF